HVPALVPGPAVPRKVPVHDVPTARAEPELDRSGVDHDPIADGNRSDELGEHVRGLVTGSEIYGHPLKGGALCENRRDEPGAKRWHGRESTRASERRDETFHALVTRLERILAEHRPLRLIVELQVYPVARVVALAFLGALDERAAQPGTGRLRWGVHRLGDLVVLDHAFDLI